MKMASGRIGLALAAVLCAAGGAGAQTGPDVIVGDLSDIAYYSSTGGVHAFAIGTVSCNIGTQNLLWIASTNQHPVIGQNIYRYRTVNGIGQFEMVGQSWLKHGFTALTQNLCNTCNGVGGSQLGVGCSDPYSAGLNGGQTSAGPRWQVNPSTGEFVYPPANPSWSGSIARRIQVPEADLRPSLNAGATYFGEGQYVTPDDALSGNAWNNASYRRINIQYNTSGAVTGAAMASTTQRTKPAIYAWQEMDPQVQIARVDIPNDGVFVNTTVTPNVTYRTIGTMHVAARVTDNGNGTFHYEYAIQNLTSDRCAGGLRFNLPAGVVPENMDFKGGLYHSGDGIPTNMSSPNTTARNFSNAAWVVSTGPTTLRWATEDYRANANANAIRWGTMYNFRFDANAQPTMGTGTIELFKPAHPSAGVSPDEVTFTLPVPGVQIPRNIRVAVDTTSVPELIAPGSDLTLTARITAGDDQVQPNSVFAYYRHTSTPGAPFTPVQMTSSGPEQYTATIPGTGCGNTMSLYVRATGVSSGVVTWPLQGEQAPFERPIGVITGAFDDNFESDKAWTGFTTGDTAAVSGRWVRSAPIGTSYNPGTGLVPIQPSADHTPDPGVNCWFTGQGALAGPAGAADVDGGKTTLTSPAIDLTRGLTARVQYWRWYFGGTTSGRNDPFTVQISNDNGANWTTIETVSALEGQGGWVRSDIPITLPLTAQMRIRFIAQDLGTDDTVEAAVDDVQFLITGCEDTCATDWNTDGSVTLQDWFAFLQDYFASDADFNNDQTTSVQDIFDFLTLWFTGC